VANSQPESEIKHVTDSLEGVVNSAKNDTTVLKALIEWDNLIYYTDPELDMKLNEKVKVLCEKNLAKKSLSKIDRVKFKTGLAKSINVLGIIYRTRGDLKKAIGYYMKALKLNEELGNKIGVSNALANIGSVHLDQKDFKSGLNYNQRALKIAEEINMLRAMPNILVNIGICYSELKDQEKALVNMRRALDIAVKIDSKRDIGSALNNIGTVFGLLNLSDSLVKYQVASLKIAEELDDKEGLGTGYINLGHIYAGKNDVKKAIFYCEKGMQYARSVNAVYQIQKASEMLVPLYKAMGNFEKALEMQELYIHMRDSIASEVSKKEIVRQEFKYKYDKIAMADSVRRVEEKKVNAAKLKQEATLRYALYGGLFLTIVFGIFMFSRFRVTRKQRNLIQEQKNLVEMQKLMVEEKQREVMDSIHYAKRIQEALLTSQSYINRNLLRLKKRNQ